MNTIMADLSLTNEDGALVIHDFLLRQKEKKHLDLFGQLPLIPLFCHSFSLIAYILRQARASSPNYLQTLLSNIECC